MRGCVTAMSATAVGHSRSVLSAPPGGDPRTVGAERHAVHIGLGGVRLRRGWGRGAPTGWLPPLPGPAPPPGHPRRGKPTLPAPAAGAGGGHHPPEGGPPREKAGRGAPTT